MGQIQNKEASVARLIKDFSSSWKMKFFFWSRLPSLGFWGVKVVAVNLDKAVVSIPFSYRTQNPFRSIYFAAQAGAAEFSTGLLVLLALEARGKASMLVTNFRCEFYKKANSKITFTCADGEAVRECVERVFAATEGQKLTLTAEAHNTEGELVSKFWIEWSLKSK